MDEEKKDEETSKKEEKIEKFRLTKKQNRQLMWAIVLMASVILIVVLVPIIKQNFFDKFIYLNLDWQKTKLGDIPFYSTQIPVTDKQGQIIGSYSMNFRKDPRKLDIEINNEDLIIFKKEKIVYISFDPDMDVCGADNTIALMNLAGFLRDFANFNVSSAVTNKEYADLNKLAYVTCKNSPDNTVIILNSGNETKIKKEKGCYELTYNNCEVLEVTEKFELLILENYMSYFERK